MLSQHTFTHSASDSVTIYTSNEEPTEDDVSYLSVPFTRYLPEDDDLTVTAAELVRERLATDLGMTEGGVGWFLPIPVCCIFFRDK